MSHTGRLEGRTCLIVGGTSGIGLASALRFLREGAHVAVAGQPADLAQGISAELSALGPAAIFELEVSDAASVNELFQSALATLGGRIDILCHVAGISGRKKGDGPLDTCDETAWDLVMSVNSKGTFLTNRAAVRQMLKQPRDDAGLRGTVLNMGSVLAWSPAAHFFGTIAYAASKGAVHAMTLAAASRYALEGIRFNLLAPGLIDTPMAARAVGDPAIRQYIATKQPLGGGPCTPDDCAEAALYLCEPASRFVTGTVLTIDGGWCVSEGQIPNEPRS
jgi:NAD(P)-dependent dehydrogenase (short-subunit alcohol dehydrogenase family)